MPHLSSSRQDTSQALSARFLRRASDSARFVVAPGCSRAAGVRHFQSASRRVAADRSIKPRESAVTGETPEPACP
ncbi:hypothetical protein C0Z19_22195 [Trinickia soli]|uniref:Uncharacterized protein n=1 Tax=Trinickia soli TaxID=380675 RepID=A0A2N7VPA0_9BURK|nr:hypothetical protein CIW54_16090 [Paraburkholderia sp. T12-10]PMS18956.1 hypothetical protein C0Z19_22195 [Trinickia soli]